MSGCCNEQREESASARPTSDRGRPRRLGTVAHVSPTPGDGESAIPGLKEQMGVLTMDRKQYYRTLPESVGRDCLQANRLAIVGCGSVGSHLTDSVGRLGLPLVLVDLPGERLEEHNIIRHVLGYPWHEKLKIEGIRAHIGDLNPECPVTLVEADVVQQPDILRDALRGCTHMACCTDNEPSRHATNQIALSLGLPCAYGGVYQNGIGGEVFMARPGGACYACLSGHLKRPVVPDSEDGPRVDYLNPETLEKEVVPYLNLDVCQIALLQARVILGEMLQDITPEQVLKGNFLLFGNRSYEGLFDCPYDHRVWSIPRNEACLVCGDADDNEHVSREAARIRAAAMEQRTSVLALPWENADMLAMTNLKGEGG